jgi:hypothetical protein
MVKLTKGQEGRIKQSGAIKNAHSEKKNFS